MALEKAQGSFTWAAADTATTVKTVTPGFQAKVVIVWTNGLASATDTTSATTHARIGMGFAVSTSSRRSMGASLDDAEGTADNVRIFRDDAILAFAQPPNDGTGIEGALDVNDIGTDNDIDFIVDTQLATTGSQDIRVHWLALGGSDIGSVSITTQALKAASGPGSINYTGVGFEPDFILLIGPGVTNTRTVDAGFFVGAASSTSNQGVAGFFSDDGDTAMDSWGYARSGEIIGIPDPSGVPSRVATLTSFDADGFSVDYTNDTGGSSTASFGVLAIAGTAEWFVDGFTTSVTGAATVARSGYGFQPAAVMVIGAGRTESTTEVNTADSVLCIGAALSASDRQAVTFTDDNGAATSIIQTGVEYDQVYQHLNSADGSVLGLMDVQSIDSDGVTYVMDDGDDAANWVFSWAVGNDPVAGGRTTKNTRAAPLGSDIGMGWRM